MTIDINSDGISLTEALRDYVKAKLSKLEKYGCDRVKCLMKVEGDTNIVEVSTKNTFAKIKSRDMYDAVDKAERVAINNVTAKKPKYRS